jgi:3-hydroxybutyrate dehydrogenase
VTGINLEFARLLLEGGANVLFADLELRPEAQTLVNKYSQAGPRAVFKRTDVTAWTDLEAMFSTADDELGSIDIVCPGAGIYEPPFSNFWYPPGCSPSIDSPQGNHYKLLDINMIHPIRTTQMAISHFLSASPPSSPSNPKTIVHIASTAAEGAQLATPLYHTSKHAIVGFVRCLAELEEICGIRVAAVAPGLVRTPLWLDNPHKLRMVEEEKDEWVTPEQVARTMLSIVEGDSISTGPAGSVDIGNSNVKIAIKGGIILEVTSREVREMPLYNNPGPAGKPGAIVSNRAVLRDETVGQLKPGWGKQ